MAWLLHVIGIDEWDAAQPDGLACPAGGFIHLCTAEQLPFVLERHFAGRQRLVVLHVDAEELDVRWEVSEPGLPAFPHLYEDLPVGLVRRADWV